MGVHPLALLIEAAVRLGDKDGAKLSDSAPGKLGETIAGLRRAPRQGLAATLVGQFEMREAAAPEVEHAVDAPVGAGAAGPAKGLSPKTYSHSIVPGGLLVKS